MAQLQCLRRARKSLAAAAVSVLFVVGAGCSEAGDQDPEASARGPAAADEAPSMYLDQVVRMLDKGRNTQLEGYHQRLDNCRQAGIAIQPVGESDERLIGTQRWRMWRDGKRYAYRMESWHVAQPEGASSREDLCTFTLGLTGLHGYVDAQRAVTLVLETGERTESAGNPDIVLTEGASVPGGSSPLAGPSAETVAGQPCNRWSTQHGATVCVWSGGERWGFGSTADGEFDAGAGLHANYVVLDASPPPDAIGYELKTTTFLTDAPLDQDDMMPRE